MFKLLSDQIDKVKDPVCKAFLWRFYNTFKSVIIPVVLPVIIYNLEQHPDNWLEMLTSASLWGNLAYVSIIAVLGATLAGVDKVYRMGDGTI